MVEAKESINNFAILGEEDLILGFKALGFKTYSVNDEALLEGVLGKIISDKTGICLVSEKFWLKLANQIKNLKIDVFPIFLPFSLGEGKDNKVLDSIIKEIKLKATGKV